MSEPSDTAAPADPEQVFTLHLQQENDYEFRVSFDMDGVDDLLTDEPAPLGSGRGPNPSRLLAAAVANCLSASLLFCLRKSRVEGASVRASVTGTIVRGASRRLRVGGFDVSIHVDGVDEANSARLDRCLGLFEDFCVVTESVRQGIPVAVEVSRG